MRSTLIFYTATRCVIRVPAASLGPFWAPGQRTVPGSVQQPCGPDLEVPPVNRWRVALVHYLETLRYTSVASSYCRCILKIYMIYHFFPRNLDSVGQKYSQCLAPKKTKGVTIILFQDVNFRLNYDCWAG